ncbi:MAG: hypothetical protein C0524_18495 [Rhodobacter sp.]|nr:hypothetical protein [Rhodobacter sp.]
MRFVPACLLFALVTRAALAEAPPTTCETQRDIPEMVDCSLFHLGKAERELGDALTVLRSRFPRTATQLDQAQAAWASYRDATCYYVAYPDDFGRGSESVLDELSCKKTETRRRAAELRKMFSD